MSDDEYETMSNTSMKGDEAFAKRKQGVQKNELNEQLKDYINQWRDERAKEEAELKRLKDKQAARKEIRAEQDRLQAQKKKEEEDQRKKAEAEKKAAEEEVKKKQMEEAEIKRQEMMAAQKEGGKKSSGPAMDARKEMSKTKEQVEEEMKISLRIRIKPLDLDSMDSDELKQKAQKIFDTILPHQLSPSWQNAFGDDHHRHSIWSPVLLRTHSGSSENLEEEPPRCGDGGHLLRWLLSGLPVRLHPRLSFRSHLSLPLHDRPRLPEAEECQE